MPCCCLPRPWPSLNPYLAIILAATPSAPAGFVFEDSCCKEGGGAMATPPPPAPPEDFFAGIGSSSSSSSSLKFFRPAKPVVDDEFLIKVS